MNPVQHYGLLLLFISALASAEEPAVSPYRPTISNPAQLSAPGFFEIESGIATTRNPDGSRQSNLPVLVKYAFTENIGLLIGGDLRLRQTNSDGNVIKGHGDTTLLLKHRWSLESMGQVDNDGSNLGLEWGVKSPTATTGLGSGKADTIINGIYSTDFADITLDINLGITRLGTVDRGSRSQWNWATALSKTIIGPWGAALEFSGNSRRGAPSTAQAMMAVSYSWNRKTVVDAGFARGVHNAAIDRSVFAGISILLD